MYHNVIINLPTDRHVGCFQILTVSNKDSMGSLVAQRAKHLPAMEETQIQSLGREDSLEEEMATHSSIPDWKFHGQRRLAGCSPWGHKESDMTEQLTQLTQQRH